MNNLERYNKVFSEVFELEDQSAIEELKEWDSASQMNLIASIEEEFDIMFDTDDILTFSSYQIGKTIMSNYEVVI